MTRTVLGLGLALAGVFCAMPASAHDDRRGGVAVVTPAPRPSVFSEPRDPWRSWGVRPQPRHRVGPPHAHVTPRASAPVWVEGGWVWDGATWLWWPGHWRR